MIFYFLFCSMLLSCFYHCRAFFSLVFSSFRVLEKPSDLVSLVSFSPPLFRVQFDWCVSIHSHTPLLFRSSGFGCRQPQFVCRFCLQKSRKLSLFQPTLNVITDARFIHALFFLPVKRKTGASNKLILSLFLRTEEKDAPSLFSKLFLSLFFGIFYNTTQFSFPFLFNILSTQKLSPFPLQLVLKYCRWKLFKTSLLTFQTINLVFSYNKEKKKHPCPDPFCCFFSLDDLPKFPTLIVKNPHMDLDNPAVAF